MPRGTTKVSPDGRNKLNRRKWAIIVVPGIMGSRVKSKTGDISIWNPDSTGWKISMAIGTGYKKIGEYLDPSKTPGRPRNEDADNDEPKKGTRLARGWGGVSWDFYGKGILAIEKAFKPKGAIVFVFAYDWRQDNSKSGWSLLRFIDTTIRKKYKIKYKPIVVTHSMGGLVTRAACCRKYHGVKGSELIAAVVHTFHPTYGAPEAYSRSRLGDHSSLGKITGKTPESAALAGYGVEAGYQLIPNHLYTKINHRDNKWLHISAKALNLSDLYDDPEVKKRLTSEGSHAVRASLVADPYPMYKDKSGWLGLLHAVIKKNAYKKQRVEANIERAERFHKRLVKDYIHPQTWALYGTGLSTVIKVDIGVKQQQRVFRSATDVLDMKLTKANRGDATVADASAVAFEERPELQGIFQEGDEVEGASGQKCVSVSGIEHSKGVNGAHKEIVSLITAAYGKIDLVKWAEKTGEPATSPALKPSNGRDSDQKAKFHKVKREDQAGRIAKRYGITLEELKKLNPGKPASRDWDKIRVGEIFKVR